MDSNLPSSIPQFFVLNEDHKLNNLSKQSVSGASESSNNLDKTTSQTLRTKVPSKSKPKIKLSHQLDGLIPLTVILLMWRIW